MNKDTIRKRRSEALSKDEHKAFTKMYAAYPTKTDAAESFNIKRQVLDLVVLKGSGSPETIQLIREKISA